MYRVVRIACRCRLAARTSDEETFSKGSRREYITYAKRSTSRSRVLTLRTSSSSFTNRNLYHLTRRALTSPPTVLPYLPRHDTPCHMQPARRVSDVDWRLRCDVRNIFTSTSEFGIHRRKMQGSCWRPTDDKSCDVGDMLGRRMAANR